MTTDTHTATLLVQQHVDQTLRVVATRPLRGGMVNRVEEWITDGQPSALVAKITTRPDHSAFHSERDSLEWFRRHAAFPVPKPYACFAAKEHRIGTCLLMERLPGCHLGEARLTHRGLAHFQRSLADVLAGLHDHKRNTYGSALNPTGAARWLDVFAPRIEAKFRSVADRLRPRSRDIVEHLLKHLDAWLPECGDPTLVHGDLWATNILLDDRDPDRPVIAGFVDGSASFADVEYELAYLRVFHTADAQFFGRYVQRHPLRSGFERRCRVYWLHTMLLHVDHYGDDYLPRTELIVREIELMSQNRSIRLTKDRRVRKAGEHGRHQENLDPRQ